MLSPTPSTVRIALTLAVFAGSIVLVLVRPRGWNEAWWTVLGAAAMGSMGFVSTRDVLDVTFQAKNALLFLAALLLLSSLVERSGFFDWAAILAGRMARGRTPALHRNLFLLGALTTMALSLDTTAVMLTPIVLSVVAKLRLPARPFLLTCAFVANFASSLLPVSNLTNLLFADTLHLGFAAFAARMSFPQIAGLAVAFALLRLLFRHDLASSFDVGSLPEPSSAVPDRVFFRAAVIVLFLVLVGYFAASATGVQPYVAAFAGAAVLSVVGARRGLRIRFWNDVSWGIFPFVIGLFVVVRGVENLGLADRAAAWIAGLPHSPVQRIGIVAAISGVASNVMNNLPAALVARSALQAAHADSATVAATLIGTNFGSAVLPFGSLATMLVLQIGRGKGETVENGSFTAAGLCVAPIVLLAASLALAATFAVR